MGSFITHELLKTKRHTITALTRPDSSNTTTLPAGVHVKPINYSDPSSLVAALQGQDALIITMAVTAPRDQESKLIRAAAEAGVPFVMPNEWGIDHTDASLAKESMIGEARNAARSLIKELGKSAYISLVCGFWYEYSLGGSEARYGFDFPARKVTFFDQGTTKINTSTWEQCGRAVAALFSLDVMPEKAGKDEGADAAKTEKPTLSQFKNGVVYISSFLVSQRDMFESVMRVTGTTEKDWSITYQDVKERYLAGVEEMKKGNLVGFVKLLYARDFYPDGCGNFEARHGLHNKLLGLPKEDLDEKTKIAIQLAEEGVDVIRPSN
jgi:hypothetical protein